MVTIKEAKESIQAQRQQIESTSARQPIKSELLRGGMTERLQRQQEAKQIEEYKKSAREELGVYESQIKKAEQQQRDYESQVAAQNKEISEWKQAEKWVREKPEFVGNLPASIKSKAQQLQAEGITSYDIQIQQRNAADKALAEYNKQLDEYNKQLAEYNLNISSPDKFVLDQTLKEMTSEQATREALTPPYKPTLEEWKAATLRVSEYKPTNILEDIKTKIAMLETRQLRDQQLTIPEKALYVGAGAAGIVKGAYETLKPPTTAWFIEQLKPINKQKNFFESVKGVTKIVPALSEQITSTSPITKGYALGVIGGITSVVVAPKIYSFVKKPIITKLPYEQPTTTFKGLLSKESKFYRGEIVAQTKVPEIMATETTGLKKLLQIEPKIITLRKAQTLETLIPVKTSANKLIGLPATKGLGSTKTLVRLSEIRGKVRPIRFTEFNRLPKSYQYIAKQLTKEPSIILKGQKIYGGKIYAVEGYPMIEPTTRLIRYSDYKTLFKQFEGTIPKTTKGITFTRLKGLPRITIKSPTFPVQLIKAKPYYLQIVTKPVIGTKAIARGLVQRAEGVIGMIVPSKIKKFTVGGIDIFPKTMAKQRLITDLGTEQVVAEAGQIVVKSIPKIKSLPTPKSVKLFTKSEEKLEKLIVPVAGQSVSQYYGTGQYERTAGGQISKQINLELQKSLQLQIQIPRQLEVQIQVPKQIQVSKQLQVPKQLLSQIQIPKQIQVSKQLQMVKQIQITKQTTKQVPRIIPPKLPPIIPPTSKALRRSLSFSSGERLVKGYNVLVKRFGKYQKVGGVLSKGEAVKLGEAITKGTLAASFKIKEANAAIKIRGVDYTPNLKEFRTYKIQRGLKVPLQNEYIQRRGFRLGSGGERREIQKAKQNKIGRINIKGIKLGGFK